MEPIVLRFGDATNFIELRYVTAAHEDAKWIFEEEDLHKPFPADLVAFSVVLSCADFRGYHPELWFRLDNLRTAADDLKSFVEKRVKTATFAGNWHDGEFVMQCYTDLVTNSILVSTSLKKIQANGQMARHMKISFVSEVEMTTLTGFIEDLTSLVDSLYLQ